MLPVCTDSFTTVLAVRTVYVQARETVHMRRSTNTSSLATVIGVLLPKSKHSRQNYVKVKRTRS